VRVFLDGYWGGCNSTTILLSWSLHSDRTSSPSAWRLFSCGKQQEGRMGVFQDVADEALSFPELWLVPQRARWCDIITDLQTSVWGLRWREDDSLSKGSLSLKEPHGPFSGAFGWCCEQYDRASLKCSLISRFLYASASGTYLMVIGFDGQKLDHLYFFSKK